MLIPKSMLWVLLMSQFIMAGSGSVSFSNIIENNSFEDGENSPTSWSTYRGANGGWTTKEKHSGSHSVKITNTEKEKSGWYYKTVLVNNSKTITFGGWSKSEKVTSDSSTGYYILINFADGSQQWYTKFHNKGTHDWEKVERILAFDKSIASVKIYAVLYYGTGTVWFDDIYVIEGENDNDVDNEKPIITLNGTSTISLNVGETYTDAGAKVTDNVDKNLQVIVGGDTVNTSIAGTYVITYNARDEVGNKAVEVKRTVIVKTENTSSNKIENFSFEQGESNPTSWSTYGGAKGGWTTNESHSGTHSVKITNTQQQNSGWNYKTILINKSKTITFGGWNKAKDVGASVLNALDFKVTFADGSHIWYYSDTKFKNGTHDWENVEYTKTFDKEVVSVKPYVLLYYGIGTVWFDDIYVIEGENSNSTDTEKPVISLVGASTVQISKGSKYVEEGARATDNKDGDISSRVLIDSSSLDTSTLGVYHVLYNVQDSAGNKAEEISRIVKVFEKNHHYKESNNFQDKTVYDVNSPWSYYDEPIPKGTATKYCKTRPNIKYMVKYVDDKEKNSKVISLGSTYPCMSPALFKLSLNNPSEKILHFDFNYNREYFFKVVVETKKGERALYYTPTSTKPKYLTSNAYGFVLGSDTKDGHWHSFRRDLNIDLKSKESNNEIVSVKALYLSELGSVDDIYLTLNAKDIAKTFVKAYLADNSMVEQITSKRMIEKLRGIDDDVKEYFRAITSYHEMMYFHDLKAMVIAISKGEEIKFYFSWNGKRWILDEVL